LLGAPVDAQYAFWVFKLLVRHADASSTPLDEVKVNFFVLFFLKFVQCVVTFELDLLEAVCELAFAR